MSGLEPPTPTLDKYGIHFHGLRHTYSNMLFENNENPKVIQALLGHKFVKTTITTYNSIDKSYFKRATDLFNKEFVVDDKQQNPNSKEQDFIENMSDDQLDRLLELVEKRKLEKAKQEKLAQELEEDTDTYEQEREERRKKKKQSDMEM